ncbi:MAG: response regulator [Clostridia bacterium]|nr:response regulator [Clostridia bacterium]
MSYKLVIVQSDPTQLKRTANMFSLLGCNIASVSTDGSQIQSLVQQHQPDAVIMDAFLPHLNCDEIAAQLEENCSCLLVKIALSECRNDWMAARFYEQGGDFFLQLPLDYSFCLTRIQKANIYRKRLTEPIPNPARQCARKYLSHAGMPLLLKGFIYTQDAVEIAVENPTALNSLTRILYPSVANRHGVSDKSVERCIRTAIESMLRDGDIEYIYQHFGYAIRSESGKPKAGEFVSILTELVRKDLYLKF